MVLMGRLGVRNKLYLLCFLKYKKMSLRTGRKDFLMIYKSDKIFLFFDYFVS